MSERAMNGYSLNEQWSLIRRVQVENKKFHEVSCSSCGRNSQRDDIHMMMFGRPFCRACQPFITDAEMSGHATLNKIHKKPEVSMPAWFEILVFSLLLLCIVAVILELMRPDSMLFDLRVIGIIVALPTLIVMTNKSVGNRNKK